MDPVAIVIVVLVFAAVSGALVVARTGALQRFQAIPKALGQELAMSRAERIGRSRDIRNATAQSRTPCAEFDMPDPPFAGLVDPRTLTDVHMASERAAVLATRMSDLDSQIADLARIVERQTADIRADLMSLTASVGAGHSAVNAKLEAIGEIARTLATAIAPARDPASHLTITQRRLDVCADLYLRLARLEAAFFAVTNPMLLPGEPYAPPDEFLSESLVWENWNDVGERAFALADGLSVYRLHLSPECRDDLATFVTGLRTRLTQEVYPNLQPEPSGAQQLALKTVLQQIAGDLSLARGALEREYPHERAYQRN